MSKLRKLTRLDLHPRPGHCSYCGGPVAPPRRSWCGDACVREYRLLSDTSAMRAEVFRRDAGICRLCGFDTEKLQRVIQWLRRIYEVQDQRRHLQAEEAAWLEVIPGVPYDSTLGDTPIRQKLQALESRGITPHQWDRFRYCTTKHLLGLRSGQDPSTTAQWLKTRLGFGSTRHLWEADHTIPVSEGGGVERGVDPLNNLRTLCIRCHLEQSKQLAGRRARKARVANQAIIPSCTPNNTAI